MMKRLQWIVVLMVFGSNAFSQSVNSVVAAGGLTQFHMTEFDVEITASFTNPFDAKDIALDMAVTSPSGKILKLPCFFVSGNASGSSWKARFTPRELGTYTYRFEISKNDVIVATSSNKNFSTAPSARKGFLHKNNLWTFKYDNGETFRGIGENYGWEPRNYEESSFRGAYKYNYLLPKLADNGVNFIRTWMCPWNLPLQWKKVTQTNLYANSNEYFNPSAIDRMEELVDMCDSLGIHMMLTLDYHGALTDNWSISNFNSANGGPVSTPAEFFTNSSARSMYKNRLRYLVARWGYSPSIGAWEFFNEIDNAVFNESNGGRGNYSHADITAWHNEMSTFLRSIDLYEHLITTSVSHRDISGMNNLASIDFNQRHVYGDPYVGQIDQTIKNYINATAKPYVIGEFGYRYEDDNYDPYATKWDYDFRQGMWLGLFSPTPILPMTWWWEMFDAKSSMTKYFNAIAEIEDQMRLAAGPAADYAQISTSGFGSGQKVMAMRAGKRYYVYVLNTSTTTVSTNVTLSGVTNGTYKVKSFDPKNGDDFVYTTRGAFTASGNTLTITNNSIEGSRERILVIVPNDDSGEQHPTGSLMIPGKIEAEDFDTGGEGVAYHDYESSNTGNLYRNEGVDIEACSIGGFNVTDIVEGEWLEYTAEVSTAGSYTLTAQVAALSAGKTFHVEIDGNDVSGKMEVPDTNDMQIFQQVSVVTPLITEGDRIIRIVMDSSGFNLDNIEFSFFNKAPRVSITSPSANDYIKIPNTVDVTVDVSDDDGQVNKMEFFVNEVKVGEVSTSPFTFSWTPSVVGDYMLKAKVTDDKGLSAESSEVKVTVFKDQLPFDGAMHMLPGRLEAEKYDIGGEGTAYHDLSPGNKFNQFREDDVDIELCIDVGGGYSLGDLQTGEWVEYTVEVNATGTYDIDFRVASAAAGSKFHMEVDGSNVTGSVTVPNTGGWQSWVTLSKNEVSLSEGIHVLRLSVDAEFFNLNYVDVATSAVTTSVDNDRTSLISAYPNPFHEHIIIESPNLVRGSVMMFNVTGQMVYASTFQTGEKISTISLRGGLYVMCIQANDDRKCRWLRLVKK